MICCGRQRLGFAAQACFESILLAALRGVAGKNRTATQILAWRCSSARAYGRFSQGFARFSRGFRFQNDFVKGSGEQKKNFNQFLRAAGAPARPRAPPNRGPRGTQKLVRTIQRPGPVARRQPFFACRGGPRPRRRQTGAPAARKNWYERPEPATL